jgi:cbb3-type cytochrome oxidase maturation protein
MSILLFLVPVALSLGLVGLAAFLWALKSGQFDDLDGAAWRILDDEDIGEPSELPRPRGDERRSA